MYIKSYFKVIWKNLNLEAMFYYENLIIFTVNLK